MCVEQEEFQNHLCPPGDELHELVTPWERSSFFFFSPANQIKLRSDT